jgi:hypothetical protein
MLKNFFIWFSYARNLSLVAKVIAASMIIVSWVRYVFFGVPVDMSEILKAAGGVAAVFGTVDINLMAEKFGIKKAE